MLVFHGCSKKLSLLKKGAYVTKSRKDAQKFGYRRAVQENSPKVYLMELEIDEDNLVSDPTRHRSYQLLTDAECVPVEEYNTYDTPNKLGSFKRGDKS